MEGCVGEVEKRGGFRSWWLGWHGLWRKFEKKDIVVDYFWPLNREFLNCNANVSWNSNE